MTNIFMTLSNMREYAIYFFTIFICVPCLVTSYKDVESKSSLVFVLDITDSMVEEIEELVKNTTDAIFDAIDSSDKSPIENIILVTFADGGVKPTAETFTDRTQLKNALKSINIVKTNDCPELAMDGIKKGLELASPGSYVFVFTDGSSRDNSDFDKVKYIAREKECQVDFMLSGHCPDWDPSYESVYYDLAIATSGQVFDLEPDELDRINSSSISYLQIMEHVKDTIQSRRTTLYSKSFEPGTRTVEFETDSRSENMSVSITSSDKTKISLRGPDGELLAGDPAFNYTKSVIVFRLNDTLSGYISLSLTNTKTANVKVTTKSDVRIRHGFSTVQPVDLTNTCVDPKPGVKYYLIIKLYGEGVKLISSELLNEDYEPLTTLPLRLYDDKQKLYITSLLDLPLSPFRIAAKGIDLDNNASITRYGSLVIPQDSPHFAPTVNIEGSPNVSVFYNNGVVLFCKIIANPEPEIIWKDDEGENIFSTEVIKIPERSEYRASLKLDGVVENVTYSCTAYNFKGNDQQAVDIFVMNEPHFSILERPENKSVAFMEKVVLNCRVDAFPMPKITWVSRPKRLMRDLRVKVKSLADGSELIIDHMIPKLIGFYTCKLENTTKRVFLECRVDITGYEKPLIDVENTDAIHIKEGESATIACRVVRGMPPPMIVWHRQNRLALPIEMPWAKNRTHITLRHLNRFDSGDYYCDARNVMGKDSLNRRLIVEYPPSIKNNRVSSITVKEGDEIMMSCEVDGVPRPEVHWSKDSSTLRPLVFGNVYNVRISEAQSRHTGIYTCKATNKHGAAEISVNVTVHSLYLSTPMGNSKHTMLRGLDTFIDCDVKGYPVSYQWIFINNTHTKNLTVKTQILSLKNVQEYQSGYYICVGRNYKGSLNMSYELEVLSPPEIQTDIRSTYTAVSGDDVTIHCTATGNPPPSITWGKDGRTISEESYEEYDIIKDGIVIKNVKNDEIYFCQANNDVDTVRKEFRVIVNDNPSDMATKNTTVFIEFGERATVMCFIDHDERDTIIWYRDDRKITGELQLFPAQFTDSGIYTCRVIHLNRTSEFANTIVTVGYKPRFLYEKEDDREYELENDVYFDCAVDGYPNPVIKWWHNYVELPKYSNKVQLSMKANVDNMGSYKCKATNNFGNVTRWFQLPLSECKLHLNTESQQQPLVISASDGWPFDETNSGITSFARRSKVSFSCASSNFVNFPHNFVQADCEGGPYFYINSTLYNFYEIQCSKPVTPRKVKIDANCFGTDTEMIDIGFDGRSITAYQICVDKNDYPIYSRLTIMKSLSDNIPSDTRLWDGDNTELNQLYTNCMNQHENFNDILGINIVDDTTCCFTRRQLVNPRDVFPGAAQRATYSLLNMVPHWSTCHSENWDELEKRVRKLAKRTTTNIIVYTGTYGIMSRKPLLKWSPTRNLTLLTKNGQPVPLFVWKVVQHPATKSSLAIIQFNIPELTSKVVEDYHIEDIGCDNISWLKGIYWKNLLRGYTICTDLDTFVNFFKMKDKKVFVKGCYGTLNNTITKS